MDSLFLMLYACMELLIDGCCAILRKHANYMCSYVQVQNRVTRGSSGYTPKKNLPKEDLIQKGTVDTDDFLKFIIYRELHKNNHILKFRIFRGVESRGVGFFFLFFPMISPIQIWRNFTEILNRYGKTPNYSWLRSFINSTA